MSAPIVAGLLLAAVIAPANAATLLHEYRFDSSAADSAGGADGTLFGGAAIVDHALALNGGGYAEFASHLVPNAGAFSVSFWVQETQPAGGYMEVISQGFSGGPGFYIGHTPWGTIRVADNFLDTGVAFGPLGTWMHFALVVQDSGTRLYRDGAVIWGNPAPVVTTAAGDPTRLGRQFTPYGEFLTGAIDDVRIYSGGLSGAEVAAQAAAGRSLAAVPEPGPAAMLLTGLAALATLSGRARRSNPAPGANLASARRQAG